MKSKIISQNPVVVLELTNEEVMVIQRSLTHCIFNSDLPKPTYAEIQPLYNGIGFIINEYRKILKKNEAQKIS